MPHLALVKLQPHPYGAFAVFVLDHFPGREFIYGARTICKERESLLGLKRVELNPRRNLNPSGKYEEQQQQLARWLTT